MARYFLVDYTINQINGEAMLKVLDKKMSVEEAEERFRNGEGHELGIQNYQRAPKYIDYSKVIVVGYPEKLLNLNLGEKSAGKFS